MALNEQLWQGQIFEFFNQIGQVRLGFNQLCFIYGSLEIYFISFEYKYVMLKIAY